MKNENSSNNKIEGTTGILEKVSQRKTTIELLSSVVKGAPFTAVLHHVRRQQTHGPSLDSTFAHTLLLDLTASDLWEPDLFVLPSSRCFAIVGPKSQIAHSRVQALLQRSLTMSVV